MGIEQTERLLQKLQDTCSSLITKIGKVQIGSPQQFPYGWRKAAKGRTVWRILEELVLQNLEAHSEELGISEIIISESETSIFDFSVLFMEETDHVFVNVKSAVLGGKTQKDDISKGVGLLQFYEQDSSKDLIISTFFLEFLDDMSIEIKKCSCFPVAWIPDVYINPSNNGNLQSSKYKDIEEGIKRTTNEFHEILKSSVNDANQKKLLVMG